MTKEELIDLVNREDFLEYMSSLTKEQVDSLLGEKFSRMVGFDQNNVHHCYDLWGHTIHTVDSLNTEGITKEEAINLKIAALYHDIGKPDVVMEKNGKNVFYGHAKKSEEIAQEELNNVGLSPEEIDKVSFYIAHHDDFISYKKDIPSYLSNHMYIRKIDSNTVAEKMIENTYDFEKMGLTKEQIRYACKYLVVQNDENIQDKEIIFTSPNGNIDVNIDIDAVKDKMISGEYTNKYIPSKRDYELLINLCKADANAQTKFYAENGKVLCSRKEKLENMESINNVLDEAYKKTEDINYDINLDKMLFEEISLNEKKTNDLKESKELFEEYNELDINKKEK